MKRPVDLLPAVNLTPFTLTAYETRALILEKHPAAYIEITGPRGEVVE